ncbi:MAG: hypothetical protein SWO11_17035 [Thermodesulfobacteriota bacterium]|nr:hypothetical protein [Thermodesulfobacteriota bacterium]
MLIDTNVLLYAVNESLKEFSIANEFLRIGTHPKVFDRPLTPEEAWSNIVSLTSHPNVVILKETQKHSNVFNDIVSELNLMGNFWHDCHIAAIS